MYVYLVIPNFHTANGEWRFQVSKTQYWWLGAAGHKLKRKQGAV